MIIIVLSDFRIHMLAAAFSIGKRLEKNNKVCYVSSKAFLIKNDYGNNFLNKLSRIIAKHILRLHKVIILPFTKYPAESNDLTGVFSSLYSLTSDSTADKEKYPKIWDDLLEIDAASEDLFTYLIKFSPSAIYVFNGRISSVYKVAKFAKDKNIPVFYYEYGRCGLSSYTLTDFPIHDLYSWGKMYIEYFDKKNISIKKLNKYKKEYISSKFNNKFSSSYDDTAVSHYDLSIYISSTHEFMSLASDVLASDYANDLAFVKDVIRKNPGLNKVVVRCHPNQVNDVGWRDSLAPLVNYCDAKNIEVVLPDSPVSSYALLINSDRVAVNISSIAVEAILLGKMPQIYGWPPYRYVYDCARRKSLNHAEVIDYFASVMSVSRFACQHRYGIGWIIALFVFRIINKLLGLVVKNL